MEKDEQLAEFLKEKFTKHITEKRLEIISADILKLNTSGYSLLASGYKLIANIPYYITSHLFEDFFGKRFPAVFDGFDGPKRSGGEDSGG